VRIASLAAAPADGAAWSSITPALATNYTGVSTNNNGSISATQNTPDLVNSLGTVTADKLNVSFGIEQKPMADPKVYSAPNSAFVQDLVNTLGGKPTSSILANSILMSAQRPNRSPVRMLKTALSSLPAQPAKSLSSTASTRTPCCFISTARAGRSLATGKASPPPRLRTCAFTASRSRAPRARH
jgi:hypothetical protein